jgi:undecaprenyl diphosphate synthase
MSSSRTPFLLTAHDVPPLAKALPHALHVAIISDGNGRWASSQGLPRRAGHRAGAAAASKVIAAAPQLGVHTLTFFALSAANWQRPASEVRAILNVLHEYLLVETSRCIEEQIRISVIGRRDRLPRALREAIADCEAATASGQRLHLRLAIDYSSREAIYLAACRFYKVTQLSTDAFTSVLGEVHRGSSPEVDLVIRTGGEQRLSDFLLWESAFAELIFLSKRWPDFTVADLAACIEEFRGRERTRGALPKQSAG